MKETDAWEKCVNLTLFSLNVNYNFVISSQKGRKENYLDSPSYFLLALDLELAQDPGSASTCCLPFCTQAISLKLPKPNQVFIFAATGSIMSAHHECSNSMTKKEQLYMLMIQSWQNVKLELELGSKHLPEQPGRLFRERLDKRKLWGQSI